MGATPPSVTPFHIDRENNFWLQIRSRKLMHVWDPTDSEVVSPPDREAFIVNADLDNVRLKPGMGPAAAASMSALETACTFRALRPT
jgi:hypothetical protein